MKTMTTETKPNAAWAERLQALRAHKAYLPLLSLLGGLLLGLSWYAPLQPLAFIALLPLLELEQTLFLRKGKTMGLLLRYTYLMFLVWNVTVYWWLWNASGWATLGAWGVNALLQLMPVGLYHFSRRNNPRLGSWLLALLWISFEYLHLHWDFSWPWINLGNLMAEQPQWIQWYEYSGALGGSLWILTVNLALFAALQARKGYLWPALLIALPVGASYYRFFTYQPEGEPVEVVAIQPNLDCYTEKFPYNAKTGEMMQGTYVPFNQQMERFLLLSEQAVTPRTAFVFWPETAMHENFEEQTAISNPYVQQVIRFVNRYPHLKVVAGADTYSVYGEQELTPTARYAPSVGYYDSFNTAMGIGLGQRPEFYHKSQLVIGVETMPFVRLLKRITLNFGGTVGGLGRQDERAVFAAPDGHKTGPAICYESVYGDYMTEYVRKGAQFLAVITNDGWWGDTPGHVQHLKFSVLRAIETRKHVVRSANTGITCLVDQRGEILDPIAYGQTGALKGTVLANDVQTFYVRYGDYIGKVAAFLSFFLVLGAMVKKKTEKLR